MLRFELQADERGLRAVSPPPSARSCGLDVFNDFGRPMILVGHAMDSTMTLVEDAMDSTGLLPAT